MFHLILDFINMALPPLNILKLTQEPILEQLRFEEALLRADDRNWCILNTGSTPAIVLGISGKPERDIDLVHWQKKPVDLIRRFSGGGTVFVDSHTCFLTLICNEECAAIPSFPDKILHWNAYWYADLLKPHGFQVKENDYVLNERKFAGNAQYLSKKRWLHHTSLLWDYEPDNMRYLQIPHRMPAYRQQRSHADFLCKLKDCFPAKESFLQLLTTSLHHRFNVTEVSKPEIQEILKKPHRQATQVVL